MSNYTKTTNFAAKDSLPSGNAAKIVKGTEIDTEFNNIATASATKANTNNAALTGIATFETISDGTTAITGFVDEDNMASDSATLLPTQQSVKAYVDSQVTAQDLDVTDGSTSIDIDLDSESLGILGGTGIDSTASGTGVTLAIDSTVATLTGSQTLSNKTLSTPVVSGNLTTDGLLDGRDVAADGTKLDGIESGATADQTAAEIKTAYESNANTNAFTDADESKLDGIEASADVTDTANVTAAGALMDSELTSEASVKALNQGVATTDSPTFAGVTAPVTGNVTGNLTGNVTGDVTGDLTGDVTGNVTGNLTGSVLTAAQTNITSVGTLGSLTVSGDVTVDTNTLKVDSTNNRVGLLNASPDVTLDVGSATDAVHVPTGTTAQRPTGAAGYFRYNSTLEQFEGYTDAWGAIGGGGGSNLVSDTMTGDGVDTTLTLSNDPLNENNTQVYIDGVYQNKDTYSVSGTTLTFSTAPPSGSAVEAMTIQPTAVNVPADASVTSAKLSGDLVTPGALNVTGTVTADGGTIVSTGSDAFSSKAVGGYAIQAYQDATSSGHTALDLRSDATTNTRYLIRGYNDAAGTPTEVFSVGADGTVTAGGLTVDGGSTLDALELTASSSFPATGFSLNANGFLYGMAGSQGFILRSASNSKALLNISENNDISFYEDTGTTPKMVWSSSAERLSVPTLSITDGSITTTAATGDHTVFNSTGADADFRVRTGANTHSLYVQGNTGNVGIGTSSPDYLLHLEEAGGVMAQLKATDSNQAYMKFVNSTTGDGTFTDGLLFGLDTDESAILWNYEATATRFATSGTERARIDSSGNLLVGTTAAPTGSTGGSAFIAESVGRKTLKIASTTTGGAGLAEFINPNGVVGSISTSGSATTYSTSSDQRLKENIVDAEDAGAKVDAIQVRKFDWIADGSHQDYGMIAQELQSVAPEAVSGDADSDEMMGVDYSKLVPMLVKEIQSLRTRVQELENN